MTGICGVVAPPGTPGLREVLRAMVEAVPHRAAAGTREWISPCAALAQLGVAAQVGRPDEAAGGEAFPRIVLSARIDNLDELAHALDARSARRDGRDLDSTTLIGALLRKHGADWPRFLLGDFAIAIWDERARTLTLAWDPMGMRPLYYRAEPDRFLFASEVKQILAVPRVPARLFEPAVVAHLAERPRPPDWTFYEGIRELPAGHLLRADVEGVDVQRYPAVDLSERIRLRSEEDYVERFREIFADAVRARLSGDGRTGIFLSGGLDSGCVTAVAGWLARGEEADRRPRIYSWAFASTPECDERHLSDPLASHFGLRVSPVAADEAAPLGGQMREEEVDRDEPGVLAYQALLHRALATARGDGVDRILTGFRGDLAVGGWIFDYPSLLPRGRWYRAWREMEAHRDLNDVPLRQIVRRYVVVPARKWIRSRSSAPRNGLRPRPGPSWLIAERAGPSGNGRDADFPPADLPTGGYARATRLRHLFAGESVQVATALERAHARLGLEHADPWSDLRLVRFVAAVPQGAISNRGENKRIARQAMRGIMPEAVRTRVGKVSPAPFLDRALRETGRPVVEALLDRPLAASFGFVDAAELSRYYRSFLAGGPEDSRFWYTLSLEAWLRRFWS